MEPIPELLRRVGAELIAAAGFAAARPARVSRAPGRLDVMGGIADYTGSMVCESPLDRAAAVVIQRRPDRSVQVVSHNLLDEHKPFTLSVPLDALAGESIESLRSDFDAPGRKWAGYLAGCLAILHEQKLIDLSKRDVPGLNIALFSTVPSGAGISSSAAIEVATMINICDELGLIESGAIEPMQLASLCQQVENRVVGAPCGIMDQVTSCYGRANTLLRMVCQPHELLPPLVLPAGVHVIGVNSNVKHSVGGTAYGRTRCAAFMGHRIILEKMREMGRAAGRELIADPMNGYLANLDPDDYKKHFRSVLPELIEGGEFLARFGPTIDQATAVRPGEQYHVQHATDHHVLEARRVRQFAEFLESAAGAGRESAEGGGLLDKAGHLMYASHLSYTNDAMLGAAECDLLVELVRKNEPAGLYGAKITGGGSGGTVAILADISPRADAAIDRIMREYESKTGKIPEAFRGSSPGAWHVGSAVVRLSGDS
jgi:L-arabinokinase